MTHFNYVGGPGSSSPRAAEPSEVTHLVDFQDKTDTGSGIETQRPLTDERIDWGIGESFTSRYYSEYELAHTGLEGGTVIWSLTRTGGTGWERWEQYDEWDGGNYFD